MGFSVYVCFVSLFVHYGMILYLSISRRRFLPSGKVAGTLPFILIGGEIIQTVFKDLGDEELRKIAFEMARYHHEKYNGKGYPDGLAGEQIPLHARIMAIADVFDAVSQKRCYRDAMPVDECFEIIEKGAGTDFDPVLAKLFLDARDEVIELMRANECKED